jgi:hypothetical protein
MNYAEWETTAVPEIRVQGAELAALLISDEARAIHAVFQSESAPGFDSAMR